MLIKLDDKKKLWLLRDNSLIVKDNEKSLDIPINEIFQFNEVKNVSYIRKNINLSQLKKLELKNSPEKKEEAIRRLEITYGSLNNYASLRESPLIQGPTFSAISGKNLFVEDSIVNLYLKIFIKKLITKNAIDIFISNEDISLWIKSIRHNFKDSFPPQKQDNNKNFNFIKKNDFIKCFDSNRKKRDFLYSLSPVKDSMDIFLKKYNFFGQLSYQYDNLMLLNLFNLINVLVVERGKYDRKKL